MLFFFFSLSLSLFFPSRTFLWLGHFGLASCSLWPVHTAWICARLQTSVIMESASSRTISRSGWTISFFASVFVPGQHVACISARVQTSVMMELHLHAPYISLWLDHTVFCFVFRSWPIRFLHQCKGADLINYGVYTFTHHLSQWLDHIVCFFASCFVPGQYVACISARVLNSAWKTFSTPQPSLFVLHASGNPVVCHQCHQVVVFGPRNLQTLRESVCT